MRYLIFFFMLLMSSFLYSQVALKTMVDGVTLKGQGTVESPIYVDLTGDIGLWQKVGNDVIKKSIGTGGLGVNVSSAFSSLDIQAETGSSEIAWFRRNSGGRQFRFQSSSNNALLDMYNSSDAATLRLNAGGANWIPSTLYVGASTTAAEVLEVNGRITANSSFGIRLGNTGQTIIGDWYNESGDMYFEGFGDRDIAFGGPTFGKLLFVDNTNIGVSIGGAFVAGSKLTVIGNNDDQILISNSQTDNTIKFGGIGTYSYDVDEEPFLFLNTQTGSLFNRLDIGGGVGNGNTATEIRFKTGAINTLLGTTRMRIDINGNTSFGDLEPTELVDIDGIIRVRDLIKLDEKSTVPSSPSSGWIYMDDGTNTGGTPTLRYYNGTGWIDL